MIGMKMTMKNSFAVALVFVLATSSLVAADLAATQPLAPPLRRSLVVGDASKPSPSTVLLNNNFSGVASVNQPGTAPWLRKFGYLDARFKIPFPAAEPSFPIASNTKVFVAISLYQLQERGRVKLTDNVADHITPADLLSFGLPASVTRYCPVVANSTACQTITFVQLLAMSAGLSDTFGPQFLPYPGSLAATLRPYMSAPLRFVPGTGYFYSNPSFILAAWFVEKFSGVDFQTYLKRNIFGPLGLTRTYWDPYNGKFNLDPNRVVEYYRFVRIGNCALNECTLLGTGAVSSEYDLGSAGGAGGIVSTQSDLRRLWFALFNFTAGATNPVLSRQSVLAIVTPRSKIQTDAYYGQGMMMFTRPPGEVPSGCSPLPRTTPQVVKIVYEGGLMGALTSNVFDLTFNPPVMGQAWTHETVYYASNASWTAAQQQRVGSFWQVVGQPGWFTQSPLNEVTMALISLVTGRPI